MRTRLRTLPLLLLIALAGSACASAEQWAEWREHPTHFASGNHLLFSFRNRGEHPTPRVRASDLTTARAQSWWGEPVVVRPDQLFSG